MFCIVMSMTDSAYMINDTLIPIQESKIQYRTYKSPWKSVISNFFFFVKGLSN